MRQEIDMKERRLEAMTSNLRATKRAAEARLTRVPFFWATKSLRLSLWTKWVDYFFFNRYVNALWKHWSHICFLMSIQNRTRTEQVQHTDGQAISIKFNKYNICLRKRRSNYFFNNVQMFHETIQQYKIFYVFGCESQVLWSWRRMSQNTKQVKKASAHVWCELADEVRIGCWWSKYGSWWFAKASI